MRSLAAQDMMQTRDGLTGLADQASARETIAHWQADWPRGAGPCPMHAMLVTLGRIDTVNVAFGQRAGDAALIEVARRITTFAADELETSAWIAARLNGGNFLLVAREELSRERWLWLAEALADAIATPIRHPGSAARLRMWPRIALMRVREGDDAGAILDRLGEAASALHAGSGRRIAWTVSTGAAGSPSHRQLEADLLRAIDRDEIEVLFQPQFLLASGALIGAEALARWQHPEAGLIGGETLFLIAGRADHTAHLSRHIAGRALAAAARWPAGLRLSVNVTPEDLSADNFATEFARLVERAGCAFDRLTLEITEQVLLLDLERTCLVLDQLKLFGIQIALDDFGAGYCNFRYLKMLPVDYLKLDREMVEGLLDDERDRAVFQGIAAMARALGLRVIVEGIETTSQRDFCAKEGCEYYQGFLGAEPMSGDAFLALAAAG
ncbi:EAL domain-containing protein [Qipengyuania sp.]|uniref:bifunctional diguanylate cyclase/phosphodiesterase n=1 Tax=Qipengyuania sp. TaxID=2004515 RepID=UPI0037351190